jgi:hypothetical protein
MFLSDFLSRVMKRHEPDIEPKINQVVPVVKENNIQWIYDNNTTGLYRYTWNDGGNVVRYEIHITHLLDSNRRFKNHTLMHEYMHHLQTAVFADKINLNFSKYDANVFFDMDATSIVKELRDNMASCMDKCRLREVSLDVPKSNTQVTFLLPRHANTAELIAHFGGILFNNRKLSLKYFPKASKRFIELLESNYYGGEAKIIFERKL